MNSRLPVDVNTRQSVCIVASHGGGWEAIFEYFRANCPLFGILCISHHYAEKGQRSVLRIYRHQRLVLEKNYRAIHLKNNLVRMLLIPLIYAWQLWTVVCVSMAVRRMRFDVAIGFNSFKGFCSVVLKKLAGMKTAVYFSADFHPLKGRTDLGAYKIYVWFDRVLDQFNLLHCDAVWYNNPRQIQGRDKEGVRKHPRLKERSLPLPISRHDIVDDSAIVPVAQPILCYLGQLSQWLGMQVLIEAMPRLLSSHPGIHLRFIGGSGAEVEELRHLADRLGVADSVTFYGFITDQQKIERLLRECSIGVALYRNHPYAPIYYGDAAKIKKYFAAGLAVVTTGAPFVSEKILEYRAGCVTGETVDEFCAAMGELLKSPEHLLQCRKNALALARSYVDSVVMSDVWRDFDNGATVSPVNRRP